jgi:transcriptional regulator
MRQNPSFTLADDEVVKRVIRENPWATIVSSTGEGLVASHYPFVLDEAAEDIVLLSHVGKPDEQIHALGQREVMVIIQGPHGYISPGWYDAKPAVPTWNFVTAHLYGVPEILSDEENYRVLAQLTDHFEDPMPEPFRMERTPENVAYAQRIYKGTVGIRLRVTRYTAKAKLSQNKLPEVAASILSQLETGEQYRNPRLAAEMRRFWTDERLP